MKTLIIDNYDSYTFNLFQIIFEISNELPIVIKNDELTWEELNKLQFDNVVISPGPGTPKKQQDFGICYKIIKEINKPILGVCLGHQGIVYANGGNVVKAPVAMHGRISEIFHNSDEIFKNIPNGFKAVRYHSLICENNLPDRISKIAWTDDDIIMGIKHKDKPIWGVQFHPESICSEYGNIIIQNFIELTGNYIAGNSLNECESYCKEFENTKKVHNETLHENNFDINIRKLDNYYDSKLVFEKWFKDIENVIWLDSSKVVEGLSRYSIIGLASDNYGHTLKYYSINKSVELNYNNGSVKKYNESIFDFLNKKLKEINIATKDIPFDFHLGYVGYFGYELKGECNSKIINYSKNPDAMFLFVDKAIVFDHVEEKTYFMVLYSKNNIEELRKSNDWINDWENNLQSFVKGKTEINYFTKNNNNELPNFYLSRDKKTYIEDIEKCIDLIREGETYEVCITNKLHAQVNINALDYYMILRSINPAPYSAFLKFKELSVACSSIERFLKIDRNKIVETKPIKGTIKRGLTLEEDEKLKFELKSDEKFRSENLMIVDLLRNDLGAVCEVGSVKVPKLMDVETYSTLHQLVTTVEGKLISALTAVDCIKSCFPGGSMTGAPKIRTMDIIDSIEKEARGVYSGIIGYLSLNETADFNIVIRTAVITENEISIGVGGAIINLSSPEEEFEEMLLKSKSILNAIQYYFMGDIKQDVKIIGA